MTSTGYVNINHKDNPLKVPPKPEGEIVIVLPEHEQIIRPVMVSFAMKWNERPLAQVHSCLAQKEYIQDKLGAEWPHVLDVLAKRYHLTISFDPSVDQFRIEQWRS